MLRKSVGACAVLACANSALGASIYTNRADWQAALAGQTIHSLSQTPQTVPIGGGTFVDDELTLVFPAGHTTLGVDATGWHGDVHGFSDPHADTATFAAPIIAFGADIGIGVDTGIGSDAIRLHLDTDYVLNNAAFSSLNFWGWIADGSPVQTLIVTSASFNNFYGVANVQYVTVGGGTVTPTPVPLPPAALAALPMLGAVWVATRRRARG